MTTEIQKAYLWDKFARAIDEGRVSVILEGVEVTIDGGLIVTDLDEVIDHISKE